MGQGHSVSDRTTRNRLPSFPPPDHSQHHRPAGSLQHHAPLASRFRHPAGSALLLVELSLDLSDVAAELQAMAELLQAVEEGRDLSRLPAAQRPPIPKPQTES